MILTGSSGLYVKGMGDNYVKRKIHEYIKEKVQDVFYDPEVATKELVDKVFETVNDWIKAIRTLALAKSAIHHNMAKELPNMHIPTCFILGKNDQITPPDVADKFQRLLPDDIYIFRR